MLEFKIVRFIAIPLSSAFSEFTFSTVFAVESVLRSNDNCFCSIFASSDEILSSSTDDVEDIVVVVVETVNCSLASVFMSIWMKLI